MCRNRRFFFLSSPYSRHCTAQVWLQTQAPNSRGSGFLLARGNLCVPSPIQHPAPVCLQTQAPDFGGFGFLLARGKMRWRTGDTCLSVASCVPCSPSLAVSRELRGTFPEPPSTPDRILAASRRLTFLTPHAIFYLTWSC